MEERFEVEIKNICQKRFIIGIKDDEPQVVNPNGGSAVFPLGVNKVLTISDPNVINIPSTNITLPAKSDLHFIPAEKADKIIISHDKKTGRPVLVIPPSERGWALNIMLPSKISSNIGPVGPDDNVTIGDGERSK